jgi:hypothetical protein
VAARRGSDSLTTMWWSYDDRRHDVRDPRQLITEQVRNGISVIIRGIAARVPDNLYRFADAFGSTCWRLSR